MQVTSWGCDERQCAWVATNTIIKNHSLHFKTLYISKQKRSLYLFYIGRPCPSSPTTSSLFLQRGTTLRLTSIKRICNTHDIYLERFTLFYLIFWQSIRIYCNHSFFIYSHGNMYPSWLLHLWHKYSSMYPQIAPQYCWY